MAGKARTSGGSAAAAGARGPRPVRADARRNIDTLLEAAKAVFAASGVDAPVREVAAAAGVGLGTVYRHFPHRSDLVAAVFRREVDACAAAAQALAAEHEPGEALASWLRRYTRFIATKRGPRLGPALGRPCVQRPAGVLPAAPRARPRVTAGHRRGRRRGPPRRRSRRPAAGGGQPVRVHRRRRGRPRPAHGRPAHRRAPLRCPPRGGPAAARGSGTAVDDPGPATRTRRRPGRPGASGGLTAGGGVLGSAPSMAATAEPAAVRSRSWGDRAGAGGGQGGRAGGADAVHPGRVPGRAGDRGVHRGVAGGGGDAGRGGVPVLGPDRGRADDPGGVSRRRWPGG